MGVPPTGSSLRSVRSRGFACSSPPGTLPVLGRDLPRRVRRSRGSRGGTTVRTAVRGPHPTTRAPAPGQLAGGPGLRVVGSIRPQQALRGVGCAAPGGKGRLPGPRARVGHLDRVLPARDVPTGSASPTRRSGRQTRASRSSTSRATGSPATHAEWPLRPTTSLPRRSAVFSPSRESPTRSPRCARVPRSTTRSRAWPPRPPA